ncbi:hypothetical protein GC209_18450 [bacterium]|nr:hypothetical protein [bacterium]
MADDFANYTSGLDSPAAHAFAITANDSADLALTTRAIYVGGSGDVRVKTVGGGTVTFSGVSAGVILPVRINRVYVTGTTATNLIGLS